MLRFYKISISSSSPLKGFSGPFLSSRFCASGCSFFLPQKKTRNQRRDLVHSFIGSELTLPPSKVQGAIKGRQSSRAESGRTCALLVDAPRRNTAPRWTAHTIAQTTRAVMSCICVFYCEKWCMMLWCRMCCGLGFIIRLAHCVPAVYSDSCTGVAYVLGIPTKLAKPKIQVNCMSKIER